MNTDSRTIVLRAPTLAVLLATLVTATILTACGGSPDAAPSTGARAATAITIPTPEPSGAKSPTTPSTGTSPATSGFDVLANMPSAAKQHTNAGAQAFARYYIDAYGRLLMDPVKGQLPQIYAPGCQGCVRSEANIADTLEREVRWQGLYYRTLNVSEPDDGSSHLVDASQLTEVHLVAFLTTAPTGVRTGTAAPTTRPKGQDVLVNLRLAWRDDRWLVTEFTSNAATPAPR